MPNHSLQRTALQAVLHDLATHPRGCALAAGIRQHAEQLGLHPSTLYRLLRKYRQDGPLALERQRRSDRGQRRLTPETEQLVHELLEREYFTMSRPSLRQIHEHLRMQCQERGLAAPSYRTIRTRMLELRDALRLTRRGQHAQAQALTPTPSLAHCGEAPLDLVQIDHTPLDLILVGEGDRTPLGRAWLSLAIDTFSRAVLGFHVSYLPPSVLTVALCVEHAALPKDAWLARCGVTGRWNMHGLPRRIHVDNAREFHSHALTRACERWGIALSYRRKRRPRDGSLIERLLGTLAGEIHTLPGSTFSNPQDRGTYDSNRQATLTLREFEVWLTQHIVGVYHERLHQGIGTTPRLLFETGRDTVHTVPDPKAFVLDFLPFETRKVRRDGLMLHSLQYWAPELARFMAKTVEVRYDPRDLSIVWVRADAGEAPFAVGYRDVSRPPVSLWEHRAALRAARDRARGVVHEATIFEALRTNRALVERAKSETRRARRRDESVTRVNERKSRPILAVEVVWPALDVPLSPWPEEDL